VWGGPCLPACLLLARTHQPPACYVLRRQTDLGAFMQQRVPHARRCLAWQAGGKQREVPAWVWGRVGATPGLHNEQARVACVGASLMRAVHIAARVVARQLYARVRRQLTGVVPTGAGSQTGSGIASPLCRDHADVHFQRRQVCCKPRSLGADEVLQRLHLHLWYSACGTAAIRRWRERGREACASR
jgi:hypothetical protein